MVTRKGFLVSAAAGVVLPWAGLAAPGRRPSLRLGLLADPQVVVRDSGKGLQNSLGLEPALRYFDRRRADGIVVAGDLTDFGTVAGLKKFADIWKTVFPGNRRSDGGEIVPLVILGDHDMGGYMHKYPWAPADEVASGVLPETDLPALWRACFGEEWAPIQEKVCRGFRFVLAHHPRHTKASQHGNAIPGLADFLAARTFDAAQPFFLVQHRVLKETVLSAGAGWEAGETTKLLQRYPQAIALCGHGHQNAVDELCAWQGAFTALQIPSVNFCCTRAGRENGYCTADTAAIQPKGEIRKSWQGLFGTLDGDRFVVERLDLLNCLPLAPPWSLSVPRPDGAFAPAARAKASRPLSFSRDPRISVTERTVVNRAKKATPAVVVSFSPAQSAQSLERAFDYLVAAEKGGKVLAEKAVFPKGQFWADRLDRQRVECAFAKADLPADWAGTVTFAVRPRDAFGRCGRPCRFHCKGKGKRQ